MKILYLLSLIPLVVEGLSGSSKVVCSPSTVQALPGQNMTVLCRVEPPSDLMPETLEWKFDIFLVYVYRSFGHSLDGQHPRFLNRIYVIIENLKDGIVSLTLTNVTKEDEGTYTFCLPKHGRCSNITLTVVPKMHKEDEGNYTNSPDEQKLVIASTVTPTERSTLSSGEITAIGVLGVLGVFGVVGGILAFKYCWRNRIRTDLHPGSASIPLRIMEGGKSSQPPLDEGGVDPEQVSRSFIDDHLNQSHDGDVPDHYSEGGAEAAAGKRHLN